MIVMRNTYVPRPGHADDLMDMIREGHAILDYTPHFRILTPIAGPSGTVVHEIEYEDFAARDKFVGDLRSSEEWPVFMERWYQLVESGGSAEFWLVRQA